MISASRSFARAVEGGVVILRDDSSLDFVSDSMHDMIGGEAAFDKAWPWLLEKIRSSLSAATEQHPDLLLSANLPDELGGQSFFIHIFPIDDELCGGLLVVIKDRKAVDGLQADLQLASHTRQLSEGFRQVAHDINTPLNSLAINVAVLKNRLPADHSCQEPLRSLDADIRRLGHSLQGLVAQPIIHGEAASRFDLRRVVLEAAVLVRSRDLLEDVQYDVSLPDRSVQIVAVRESIKQAIAGIIANAIEAMVDVARDQRHLTVRMSADDEWATITIHDCGPGIDSVSMLRIFHLHYTTKASRSGVGLPTARIALHGAGGRLQLESTPTKGTTAKISLPLAALQPHEIDQ